MLTAAQIIQIMRFEESCANARAGFWRCGECGVLYLHELRHECDHEDLERHAEAQREIGTGRLL